MDNKINDIPYYVRLLEEENARLIHRVYVLSCENDSLKDRIEEMESSVWGKMFKSTKGQG